MGYLLLQNVMFHALVAVVVFLKVHCYAKLLHDHAHGIKYVAPCAFRQFGTHLWYALHVW